MVNIKYQWYYYCVSICHCMCPFNILCVHLTFNVSILIDLWESVLRDLQETRHKLDLPFVPYSINCMTKQFGLSQSLVLQVLEQLPNNNKCSRHLFSYHQPSKLSSWQQAVSGCGLLMDG